MTRIDIKPVSVNECWQGKRFKTKRYDVFEKTMLVLMPKITMPQKPYYIKFRFGFSSSLADIDNPIKPTMDILQKKYSFNDRDVLGISIVKEVVEKGKEFIDYDITSYHE